MIISALPKSSDHASIKLVVENSAKLAEKSEECDILFQKLARTYPIYQFVASNYFIECAINFLEDIKNYKQFIPNCKNQLFLMMNFRDMKKCENDRNDLEKCYEAVFGKYCTLDHARELVNIVMKTMNDQKQCKNYN
ncbi:unnamed protein product [Caenorhabditis angaria]|uniref:Uncharacterized protein n=1 Tax=Caenorhabditis angaria TaxID=860376 RepID=A0A9P1N7K8_9PELO|nr:unnamed protein product [Caenorhabditis angaria]